MPIRHAPRVLALATLLALSAAPVALAQFTLFGGLSIPTGDFSTPANTGWNMGGYGTSQIASAVEVGGLVAINQFGIDREQHEVGAQFGPTVSAWEFQGLVQVDIAFLKAFCGLGAANYNGDDGEGGTKRLTKFAWQLGVAARFDFLEARLGYHSFAADNLNVSWIGLTAGVIF